MEKSKIRKPVVAGQFYPDSPYELKDQLQQFIDKKAPKTDAIGCILPHAGYIYSGAVAGYTISRVQLKEKIILIGPNHTGYGTEFSIMHEGIWKTPLGEVKIDAELANKILSLSPLFQKDTFAHAYEHSLEVELPFIQYLKHDFKIVPCVVASDDLAKLKTIGAAIAQAIIEAKLKNKCLLIASSDMTHYEPQQQAYQKDHDAIKAIESLDIDALAEKVRGQNITMCGYAPVVIMLAAAKLLGARTGTLLKYQTSGDTTGDNTSVVGYAGVIIS